MLETRMKLEKDPEISASDGFKKFQAKVAESVYWSNFGKMDRDTLK